MGCWLSLLKCSVVSNCGEFSFDLKYLHELFYCYFNHKQSRTKNCLWHFLYLFLCHLLYNSFSLYFLLPLFLSLSLSLCLSLSPLSLSVLLSLFVFLFLSPSFSLFLYLCSVTPLFITFSLIFSFFVIYLVSFSGIFL